VIEFTIDVVAEMTVIETDAVADTPSASVTLAVMTCEPAVSFFVKLPPVPIWPSRLDVHTIADVNDPWSKSDADAVN
jgi:hypothetical protein